MNFPSQPSPDVLVAAAFRADRDELTRRWLDRIVERVDLPPEHVFPSDELLDHVPLLIAGIADCLADPADEIGAHGAVVDKATELGELRFDQGFGGHEILREYELLGGILYTHAARVLEGTGPAASEHLLGLGHRLFRTIAVIAQVTTGRYLAALTERAVEREERLRRFHRMLSHELKNRVGAVLGAGELLTEDWVSDAERGRFAGIVVENAREIQATLESLTALTRLEGDARRQRNVLLPDVVAEVFRRMRELAGARGVQLRADQDMPAVEVNAAALELCLSNYVSNAIKYSDPGKTTRWAHVSATIEERSGEPDAAELVVRVRDNGLGVPEEHRARLFNRFFRAHEGLSTAEGTGLGLNLVMETMETLGGRAWAEFGSDGTCFAFSLPCRRWRDTAGGDPAHRWSTAAPGTDDGGPAVSREREERPRSGGRARESG